MCKAIICNGSGEALLKIRALPVWQELELEILGVFTDGNTAWQQIQKNTPDILVAAVEQPGRSGLDLAALAKGCNPDMKVILTADSNDFVSAVRAIQLGVKDYLPAPLDLGALSAALLRSVEELRVLEQNKAIISEGERNARKSQVQCLVFEGLKAFEERYGSAVRQHMQRLTSQICIVSLDNFEAASLTDEVRGEMNRTLFRCLESLGACMTVFEQQQGTATCFLLGDSTAGVTQTRSDCVRKIGDAYYGFGWNFPPEIPRRHHHLRLQRHPAQRSGSAKILPGSQAGSAGTVRPGPRRRDLLRPDESGGGFPQQ